MRVLLLLLILLGLSSFGGANPPSKPERAVSGPADWCDLLEGDYVVVGKKPDSRSTYEGRLRFHSHGTKLDFTRTIRGGRTVRGTAVFGTVSADRIPVVRMRFAQAGRQYEGTYQWTMDYDNYARFTGYVYRTDGKTKSVGFETLFPLPPSLRD